MRWNENNPYFVPQIQELMGNPAAGQIVSMAANAIIDTSGNNQIRTAYMQFISNNNWNNPEFYEYVALVVKYSAYVMSHGNNYTFPQVIEQILDGLVCRFALKHFNNFDQNTYQSLMNCINDFNRKINIININQQNNNFNMQPSNPYDSNSVRSRFDYTNEKDKFEIGSFMGRKEFLKDVTVETKSSTNVEKQFNREPVDTIERIYSVNLEEKDDMNREDHQIFVNNGINPIVDNEKNIIVENNEPKPSAEVQIKIPQENYGLVDGREKRYLRVENEINRAENESNINKLVINNSLNFEIISDYSKWLNHIETCDLREDTAYCKTVEYVVFNKIDIPESSTFKTDTSIYLYKIKEFLDKLNKNIKIKFVDFITYDFSNMETYHVLLFNYLDYKLTNYLNKLLSLYDSIEKIRVDSALNDFVDLIEMTESGENNFLKSIISECLYLLTNYINKLINSYGLLLEFDPQSESKGFYVADTVHVIFVRESIDFFITGNKLYKNIYIKNYGPIEDEYYYGPAGMIIKNLIDRRFLDFTDPKFSDTPTNMFILGKDFNSLEIMFNHRNANLLKNNLITNF